MKKISGIERLQQYNEKPIRKKTKKIDKIVKGLCIYWVAFVVVAWITFWVKDSVPDSLIQFGLGGSVLELVMTALIEISRDKYNKMDDK
jgi:hypothetical protein